MTRFLNRTLLAVAVSACCAVSANAAITTYTSWANYNAATTGNTTIDFEAQLVGGPYTYYESSLSVGGVTFTDNAPHLFVLAGGYYGDAFTSAYLNNNSQGTQIDVAFDNPVMAFAMDIGTIFNWGGGPLTLTFHFDGGSETLDLAGEQVFGAPVGFIGFSSSSAFNSITIDDPTSGMAIDNFTYARGAATGRDVPEPGSLALAGLALAGLAAARKRRAA